MIHHAIIPLLAGLLVGVNPFVAPSLHARLTERGNTRTVLIETSLITLGTLIVLVAISWRFASFISGRLTNSLLVLGLFALAGAFYSLRPFRRREPGPSPAGWRWLTRYASDTLYYAGPAWILAMAFAMRQFTFTRSAIPFAAAALGIMIASSLWITKLRDKLPERTSRPGEPRGPGLIILSLAYGTSAAMMLAANLKLI